VSAELFVDVTPGELVIALLEVRRLVALRRDPSRVIFAVGDIYLGKVKKIMPSLNAAFIDVGYEKDAFLHYLDMGPQFSTLNKFFTEVVANNMVMLDTKSNSQDNNQESQGSQNNNNQSGSSNFEGVSEPEADDQGGDDDLPF